MKFAERYPDAQYGDEVRPNIVKLHWVYWAYCFVCKQPTEFREVNYERAFCSEECLAEMDKGYMEASRGAQGREMEEDGK